MASKAIVGEKMGMTQVFDGHDRAIPVTVLKVAPMRIVQVKTPEKEGYAAIQVTWGVHKKNTLSRPEHGHFKAAGVDPGKKLVELRLDDINGFEPGQELDVSAIESGMHVDVIATSKGKGFSGGMKRHNFKGQGAAHGNHKMHRAPGSIGACATPARVFKGMRMAGRMGGQRVTSLNLEVIAADPERQIILVKGAVPGPRGAMVIVRSTVKVTQAKSASAIVRKGGSR